MSVAVIPFHDVYQSLPSTTQQSIEKKVYETAKRNGLKNSKPILLIVMGALLALGGLFVLLAAYQGVASWDECY